jgi:hypothetical protein
MRQRHSDAARACGATDVGGPSTEVLVGSLNLDRCWGDRFLPAVVGVAIVGAVGAAVVRYYGSLWQSALSPLSCELKECVLTHSLRASEIEREKES